MIIDCIWNFIAQKSHSAKRVKIVIAMSTGFEQRLLNHKDSKYTELNKQMIKNSDAIEIPNNILKVTQNGKSNFVFFRKF